MYRSESVAIQIELQCMFSSVFPALFGEDGYEVLKPDSSEGS